LSGGLHVLTAIGSELEREYPYGMVRQLLESEVLSAQQPRRAELLSGASALAGPVLGLGAAPRETDTGQDTSFATRHGLYWLVAALSDEHPLVLVPDDSHWSDPASLRFVDFLALLVAEGSAFAHPLVCQAVADSVPPLNATTCTRPSPGPSANAAATAKR
jgi:hypothetical protein